MRATIVPITPTVAAAHLRTRRRVSPVAGWVATAAVVGGAALRIEQFASRRSLWLDEALVANNIVSRSFSGLTHPLAGQQGAPIGWLWVEHAMVVVGGRSEYVLRMVPLFAGIAGLALMRRVSRRLLPPWPAALATLLLALSPAAVRYSTEVKQYSSDLAIALLLTLLALDRKGVKRWAAVGAVAVWFSHPAVFVLAAGAVVLAPESIGPSLWWVASFALDWLVSLRRLSHNSYLHQYWAAGFRPGAVFHIVSDPGGLPWSWIATVVVAAGLGWVVARKPASAALLIAPLVVGVAAALVGAYPLEGRMALWLLPVVCIGLAGAVAAVGSPGTGVHWSRRQLRPVTAVAVVILAVLVADPVAAVARTARHPAVWVDMRPLLQAVAPMVRPGDHVWVHSNDAPAAAFYARQVRVRPDGEVWNGICPAGAAPFAPRGRVWFVYGYHASGAPPDEAQAINARFASAGRLLATAQRPGATAWLWSVDGPPPAAGSLRCLAVTAPPPPS